MLQVTISKLSIQRVQATAFGATFITLFLSGFPAHKALQYANASGALAVMRQGPMEGISSLADIEDFCSSTERQFSVRLFSLPEELP